MKSRHLIITVILLIIPAISSTPRDNDILVRARELSRQEHYTEAIELLNKHRELADGSEKLLALEAEILLKLNRPQEALTAARKRVEASARKSPWHCLAVVDIAVRLKDPDLAFLWFEKAVNRGFLNPGALDSKTLDLLKKNHRFEELMKKIENNIGLGKPVKSFAFPLIDGRRFDIAEQRGKVILMDFWATWCPPCVKGIPFLKEMYEMYSSRGFDIIAISLDSDKSAIIEYLKKEKIKWPVRFSGKGWMDGTARRFRVNLIPSYWLIDRKGILRDFGFRLRDKNNLKTSIVNLISEK